MSHIDVILISINFNIIFTIPQLNLMSQIQNNQKQNYYELSKKFLSLKEKFKDWFNFEAIPTWKYYGIDSIKGGFFEALDHKLRPIESPKRTRVICRQIYVFTLAYEFNKGDDLEKIISQGYRFLFSNLKCKNGFFSYSYSNLLEENDDKFFLYEQSL